MYHSCTGTLPRPSDADSLLFTINIISFDMYFDSNRTAVSFDPAVQADSHSELSYRPTVPPTVGPGDEGTRDRAHACHTLSPYASR